VIDEYIFLHVDWPHMHYASLLFHVIVSSANMSPSHNIGFDQP